MLISAVLSYAAAYCSLIMAAAVLLRDRKSFVHRVFAAGMVLFAAEEIFRGISYGAVLPRDVIYWQKRVITLSALIPGTWLAFSVGYARVSWQSLLSKWRWALVAVTASPIAFVIIFRRSLLTGSIFLRDAARWSITLGWPGRALQLFFLVVSVVILFNLERTVRSSIGRMRWQIKFMALGVGGLFALRIYLTSQSLLFSELDTGIGSLNAVALIAANLLFAFSLCRGRSLNVDVYLSRTTIQNSLTLILAGIYLLTVGVLARLARYVVPAGSSLPLDAFIVFIALTVLGVLLLSNRLRLKLRLFVTRHFRRPAYDYRAVWMGLTQRTTSLMDVNELCTAVSRIVCELLEILSVNVWLVDESQRRLTLVGSTALSGSQIKEMEKAATSAPEFISSLRNQTGCLDLDEKEFAWPKEVMHSGAEFFRDCRMRYAIGLHAGGELVGVMTLNDDRVGGEALSEEDFLLLETLASELAASLLNLKLSARLRHAKEVEAFQTVSTFFVHDLKNLASRLSLIMQNLPANFDNPEFRTDALRVMSRSLSKIDEMCGRLAMLRQNLELKLSECDLSRLVAATLDEFRGHLKADLELDLLTVPKALIDSEQINTVLTNLIMNAHDAVNGQSVIRVSLIHERDSVGFSVCDTGCGMSEEFIENSLFRPFHTTKKKGLGIGLFHTKQIVEAHRGRIEVTSTVGAGTEFRVVLPIA